MIITSEKELRVLCVDVLPEEIQDLRDKLETELRISAENGLEGIGLACPQIGIAKNMAIIRISKELSVDLVNAKIVQAYDKEMFEGEGCLSFPGRFEKTMRYQEIVVTNDVEPKFFIAKGLFAVAIQHEINHTEGKLLPDFALQKLQTQSSKKVRPNDICPCGSLKKYKKCCSNK